MQFEKITFAFHTTYKISLPKGCLLQQETRYQICKCIFVYVDNGLDNEHALLEDLAFVA